MGAGSCTHCCGFFLCLIYCPFFLLAARVVGASPDAETPLPWPAASKYMAHPEPSGASGVRYTFRKPRGALVLLSAAATKTRNGTWMEEPGQLQSLKELRAQCIERGFTVIGELSPQASGPGLTIYLISYVGSRSATSVNSTHCSWSSPPTAVRDRSLHGQTRARINAPVP